MKPLKLFIFLPFLAIGFLEKVSAVAGNQLCYPNNNATLTQTDSKVLGLKSKSIRKPTIDFLLDFWYPVSTPMFRLIFGHSKMPDPGTAHCRPFTQELSNLLLEEYQFSWMKIVSDVQIIDDNPWWCKKYGTLNPKKHFEEGSPSTHICYPKGWTDGIGKFICDLQHWDQIILRNEKEPTWRCIPSEFWCKNINSANTYMDIIVAILSYVIILQISSLFIDGIFLLTDPHPVIGPILPKPAPAA